jgi:hypothetical protein
MKHPQTLNTLTNFHCLETSHVAAIKFDCTLSMLVKRALTICQQKVY